MNPQSKETAVDPMAEQTPELLRQYTYRWFDEVWNERRDGAIDHFVADPVESQGPAPKKYGLMRKTDFRAWHRQLLEAFPDIWFEVHSVVVDGDISAARYSVSGTHLGDLDGLPASQKEVHITGMTMFRWRGGKIQESWNNHDQLGLLQQIGFVD
ncbi:MAG: ester cyclase [Chlorobia bacterium]|nr:ester cyclase [Fimbriimonadaceae bacterium]